jgi:hypothetical protein
MGGGARAAAVGPDGHLALVEDIGRCSSYAKNPYISFILNSYIYL